ncbi:calmodulin-4-like protein [Radiomyces spectabilis]|uniref:calmodulin-4-like protein n=1 Tax=Radiomyces spectabilis TaxID=64574 RepID=UPI00221E4379|nr:calmodulin-4-like protein [Radiomyces spectabilis]KAI8393447.1 calmodulin-4-like protein [Radiomyces spectabilis]
MNTSVVTPEELDSLREAFKLYDLHSAGGISLQDFAKVLQGLDIATDPEQIQMLIDSADANHDNKIDFDEFVDAMNKYIPSGCIDDTDLSSSTCTIISEKPISMKHKLRSPEEEEMMRCFQAFDTNNDGHIDREELVHVMDKLGNHLSAEEIKDMIAIADTNNDGYIDFEEFMQLIPPA